MSSRANYFKIGLFVLFTVIVLLVFLTTLGISLLTKDKILLETYIDESVQGLSVGSPVKNRGVQIGNVERIDFVLSDYKVGYDQPASKLILVVIAADPTKFASENKFQAKRVIQKRVEEGMRLQLTQQPLTGIAYLELDYFDPKEFPVPDITWKPNNIYVPSVKSMLSSFTKSAEIAVKKISEVNFKKLVDNVNSLVSNLDKAIDDAHVSELSSSAIELIQELKESNDSLKAFMSEIRTTNDYASKLLKPVEPSEHSVSIPELVASLDKTIAKIDVMMANYKPDIDQSVGDIKASLRNVKELTAQIKENPSAVFNSKPPAQSGVYK